MTAATNVSFRSHLQPQQLTAGVRHKLAHELLHEQMLWTLLALLSGLMLVAVISISFRAAGFDEHTRMEGLRPILLAEVGFLLFLHVYYREQRRFVMTMPATVGLVVREKEPCHFSEESSLGSQRLLVRYRPVPGELVEPGELDHASGCYSTWVELSGFSGRFENSVRVGDLVSVIFDPRDPHRVKVVELELL